jgi:hypothetical protein
MDLGAVLRGSAMSQPGWFRTGQRRGRLSDRHLVSPEQSELLQTLPQERGASEFLFSRLRT